MTYFLTVWAVKGRVLHHKQRFDTLDEALKVAGRYLRNPASAHRMIGYFSMRDGELTSLRINRATGGLLLAEGITGIDILNMRGFLEHETEGKLPNA